MSGFIIGAKGSAQLRTVSGEMAEVQRRLLIRWEYYPGNFLGFVQLAAIGILLKQF